jgi:hypothetical protein
LTLIISHARQASATALLPIFGVVMASLILRSALSSLAIRSSFMPSIIYCLSSAILFILVTLACAVFQSVMLFLRLPFGSVDLCDHT